MTALEQVNQTLENAQSNSSAATSVQSPSGGPLAQGFNLLMILMANEIQWLQTNQENVLNAIQNQSSIGFSQFQAEYDKADPMKMSGIMDALGSAIGAVIGLTTVAVTTIMNKPNISNMGEIKGKISQLKQYDTAIENLSKSTPLASGTSLMLRASLLFLIACRLLVQLL